MVDLAQYLPVILFIIVGLVFGVLPQAAGWAISKLQGTQKPDPEKNSPYECGFEPFEDTRIKFDVRYYLVAILFILFDLEVAFMIPWAVVFKDLIASHGQYAFWSMFVFIVVLTGGFIYEWKKGALEWE